MKTEEIFLTYSVAMLVWRGFRASKAPSSVHLFVCLAMSFMIGCDWGCSCSVQFFYYWAQVASTIQAWKMIAALFSAQTVSTWTSYPCSRSSSRSLHLSYECDLATASDPTSAFDPLLWGCFGSGRVMAKLFCWFSVSCFYQGSPPCPKCSSVKQ